MTEQVMEYAGVAETQRETEFRLPPELRPIPVDILRLILPDLSISAVFAEGNAQVTHCHRVTFKVTLSPGFFRPSGNQAVRVRVIDEVFGIPQTVGEVLLFLPAAGGSTQASIEWPMPADAQYTPDFNNKIIVIVDPDNELGERDKSNNTLTVTGTCLG
jgi:hypothetical protein